MRILRDGRQIVTVFAKRVFTTVFVCISSSNYCKSKSEIPEADKYGKEYIHNYNPDINESFVMNEVLNSENSK